MEPPHSVKLSKNASKIVVRAHLHRVPEKLIRVDVDSQRVVIDTLQWTKKWRLEYVTLIFFGS